MENPKRRAKHPDVLPMYICCRMLVCGVPCVCKCGLKDRKESVGRRIQISMCVTCVRPLQDASVWRTLCMGFWWKEGIEKLRTELVLYNSWRGMFINRARLRVDGVYCFKWISVGSFVVARVCTCTKNLYLSFYFSISISLCHTHMSPSLFLI